MEKVLQINLPMDVFSETLIIEDGRCNQGER